MRFRFRHNRHTRAFLSSLLPGTGQLAARDTRAGLVFLVPALVLGVVAAGLVLTTDRFALGGKLLDPDVIFGLLVAQIAVLAWRLASVGHALGWPGGRLRIGRGTPATAALIVFVLVPQLAVAGLTAVWYDTTSRMFAPSHEAEYIPVDSTGLPLLDPSDDPFAAGTIGPGSTYAYPTGDDGRVTVLLIGQDSGVGRQTANTDTMIIASLDPKAKTVSMLSIPRDTVDVPLPGAGNRVYTRKISSLASWATWHPDQFPGAPSGQAVLASALSQLTGVKIDYWAQVNLQGLVNVVNSVGGVDINVKQAFCDPYYQEYGVWGFAVLPGRYHMNGNQALAYARVRHPAGESDFTRAARQQEVVVALRDRLVSGGFLGNPVGLMQSLGNTITTNIPPSVISTYASLGTSVTRGRVYSSVVTSPLVRSTMDSRGYVLIPDVGGIRALAQRLFTTPGTLPDATPLEETSNKAAPSLPKLNCYAPKPGPVATPSPSPSPSPSGEPTPSGEPSPSVEPTPGVEPTPTGASPTPPPTDPPATQHPTPSPTAPPSDVPTAPPPTSPPTTPPSPGPTPRPTPKATPTAASAEPAGRAGA